MSSQSTRQTRRYPALIRWDQLPASAWRVALVPDPGERIAKDLVEQSVDPLEQAAVGALPGLLRSPQGDQLAIARVIASTQASASLARPMRTPKTRSPSASANLTLTTG